MAKNMKNYIELTKPGIIFGNAITTIGGFALASHGHIDLALLLKTLIGISLVIAAGCVFNNVVDRRIDGLMERTKDRAIARGTFPVRNALIFGTMLGLAGLWTLETQVNLVSALVGLVGLFFYVVVYSIWKRRSEFGTQAGSIAGAVPPVVGYVAASGRLDEGAVIIFTLLILWQMPHFYAIAINRLRDYEAAAIPVLPVRRGVRTTKLHILAYIAAFSLAAIMPTPFGYTGAWYLLVATILCSTWFALGIWGFNTEDAEHWARRMFKFSLIVITSLCVMMVLNAV